MFGVADPLPPTEGCLLFLYAQRDFDKLGLTILCPPIDDPSVSIIAGCLFPKLPIIICYPPRTPLNDPPMFPPPLPRELVFAPTLLFAVDISMTLCQRLCVS